MTKRPPKGAQAAAKRNGVKMAKTETHKWTVEAGSLLLMQGKCQEEWYHEIPKERKIKEGRIVSMLCAHLLLHKLAMDSSPNAHDPLAFLHQSVTLRQLVYD